MTDESEVRNDFRGAADHVVLAGHIDEVIDNRDRRAVPLLVIVLAVVLMAAATIVWLVKPSAPSGDPLAAQTKMDAVECESGWVVPDQGQREIAKPVAGGVHTTGATVTATLQGLANMAVVLHEVRVEVISRKPAAQGIYLPEMCASSVTPRFFDLDLSAPVPALVPKAGEHNAEPVRPVDFPLRIGPEDVEQLEITVDSPTEDVEWVLHVRWSSGTRSGDFRVDDHGKPFRTTGTGRAREWCLVDLTGWRPTCE